MNKIFADRIRGRIDPETQKLMEEAGWQKANEQEEQAFIGYLTALQRKKSGFKYLRSAALLLSVIAAAELAFEYLCKSDPSYYPFPILVCLALGLLISGISQIGLSMQARRQQGMFFGGVYVLNAIACPAESGRVRLMVDGRRVTGATYPFQETVGPMDYIFDEQGNKKGFYVRLFLGVDLFGGITKTVLGGHGYAYYLHRYCKKMHLKGGRT